MKNDESILVHAYPIGRCGKRLAKGDPCNRRAAWAHIRGDVDPPMILWMCSKHHDEAMLESKERRS